MFDNVTLKVYNLPKKDTLSGKLKGLYRSDTNTYKGMMGNMGVYKNNDCLRICGSLPKYLNDENVTPLNRDGVKLAIEKLENDFCLGLKNAVVCSVEFGVSIITKGKPFEYLQLFGNTKVLTRVEYSKWTGLETVTYTSKTGSFEFTGYDKAKEMIDNERNIPPLFSNSNVLRLEYRIRKRKGIKAKFARDLLACDLFCENVYKAFQGLFLEAYMGIDKTGRLVYSDKSKKVTPVYLREFQAEQYRQSYPKENQYYLQKLKEAGQLAPRSLERIRTADRKYDRNVYISDQNPLLRDLDAYIFDVMRSVDTSQNLR